jgi:hypothetical protein
VEEGRHGLGILHVGACPHRLVARTRFIHPFDLRESLDRLAYDATASRVEYRSDKMDGPTAGIETLDPLEFLAGC